MNRDEHAEKQNLAFRRPWPTTRRGLALWMFGLTVVMVGVFNHIISDLTGSVPEATYNNLAFVLPLTNWAVWPWGAVMVFFGGFAMFVAYCHFGRDKVGYTVLATFCGFWATVHVLSFVFYGAGERALGSTVIWLAFASVLLIIAGFPNVTFDPIPPVTLQGDDPDSDEFTEVNSE